MTVGFHTFEQFHGKQDVGSTYLRVHQLVRHWPEASLAEAGRGYDVTIYQKAYWFQHAELCRGTKLLDLCDPDWLEWGTPLVRTLRECHGCSCATYPIADFIRRLVPPSFPVAVIPDRLDFDDFPSRRIHDGPLREVGWFGYSQNFGMLASAVPALAKRGLSLRVISDRPFMTNEKAVPVMNIKWTRKGYQHELLKCDAILNPKSEVGKYRYKSENKTLISWALGLPVIGTLDDLDRFQDPDERRREQDVRLAELREKWDIRQSVPEYQALIAAADTYRKSL